MKKTEATLSINLYVNCPYCDEYFDMFDIDYLTDEGQLYKASISDHAFESEHEGFDFDVECPNCEKEFNVNSVCW